MKLNSVEKHFLFFCMCGILIYHNPSIKVHIHFDVKPLLLILQSAQSEVPGKHEAVSIVCKNFLHQEFNVCLGITRETRMNEHFTNLIG